MKKDSLKKELKLTNELKNILNKNSDSQTFSRAYDKYHEFILKNGLPSEKRKENGYLYAPPDYKNLVEKIIIKLTPPGKTVLEIGVGDGRLSYKLAEEKKCRVTGIDISDIVINLAKKRLKETEALKYIKADARHLPFKDKAFDISISKDLIEHLPPKDHLRHLREAKRTLKDKGSYIIFTPPKLKLERYKGLHLKEYSLKELSDTAKIAGFSDIGIYWVQLIIFGYLNQIRKPVIKMLNLYEFFLEKTKIYKLIPEFLNKIFIPRFVIIAKK
jgi:ubiquinone/menaquinone biosynthesis C-methylase UbiE